MIFWSYEINRDEDLNDFKIFRNFCLESAGTSKIPKIG